MTPNLFTGFGRLSGGRCGGEQDDARVQPERHRHDARDREDEAIRRTRLSCPFRAMTPSATKNPSRRQPSARG